jgi:CRP/FNR family cyclic AMP-dependent transcriptional regulator
MSAAPKLDELLKNVDLFSGLSGHQRKKLANSGREVEYTVGHDVTEQDKGALAFHLILEGEVEVSQDGKKLRSLGVGDYFGEISMIDGRWRSATVTATTPLRTFAIYHDIFDTLLSKDAEIGRQLLRTLCARLREAESRG